MKRVKGHRYLFRRGDQLYFRRAVPAHARAAFGGKAEVLASLATTHLSEARHLMQPKLAAFESRLAEASTRPPPENATALILREPSQAALEEGVRVWFAERMNREQVDYSAPEAIEAGLAQLASLDRQEADVRATLKLGGGDAGLTTQWIADALAERFGWQAPAGSPTRRRLLRLIAHGQVEANRRLKQDLEGEPRSVGDETFGAERYKLDEERRRSQTGANPVSVRGLFDGYVAERKPAPATVKAYRRQINAFIAFIGHDDAQRITPSNVVDWKDHLLTEPGRAGTQRTAKTVGETYLAALKTVIGWGFDNHRLASNPTTRVRVRTPHRHVLREKGLNDAEARTILRATLTPPPSRLSPGRAFARRWVPWLCAYTGARVDEMAQLRAEDVAERDGIWTIRITPEAGATKNHKARVVALHPHLIEQGFHEQVRGKSGFLFYDPKLHRGGTEGNPQSKKVGQFLAAWVRSLGVDDPTVQPNHGWRHRFKTQARSAGMDREVRDVVQGHVPRTEGEDYGDTLPAVMLREIAKLPRYDLG